jgi:hypothetical protein
MKRTACHKNFFQFSFFNFPKKHFFNILFPTFIYVVSRYSHLFITVFSITPLFVPYYVLEDFTTLTFIEIPNVKTCNLECICIIQTHPPLLPKMRNVNHMDCSISNKYLHFIMGVLVQVENGDKLLWK